MKRIDSFGLVVIKCKQRIVTLHVKIKATSICIELFHFQIVVLQKNKKDGIPKFRS